MNARAAVALALVCLAQQAQPRFRSGIAVVEVDASVMHGGVPVRGLTSENFAVTDDGVLQKITSVTLEQLPLNVQLVLDVSGSVSGEKLEHLVDAAQEVGRHLRSGDREGLITFSHSVAVPVPMTSDLASVDRALTQIAPGGATSVDDALHVALNVRPLDGGRSLILVFSDGWDNSSWVAPSLLTEEVQRNGVVIHAVEVRGGPLMPVGPTGGGSLTGGVSPRPAADVLPRLVAAAGGRVWSAKSSRDVRELFTRALDEMRARYLLTFSPTGVPHEGWHALKVSLRNARGDVTARPGYFADAKEP